MHGQADRAGPDESHVPPGSPLGIGFRSGAMRQAGRASGGHPAATWAWSAVIVAASITGGLLAAAVGRASWVTALGVSAVIGVAVALLTVPLGWATQVPSSL